MAGILGPMKSPGPGSGPQQTIIEVSASAKPSEVVSAVIAGSQARQPVSNPNRWIQLSFVFVIVFGCVVYFREEIWALGKDVKKHPIMAYAEQIQIQHYLGTQWLFGSGGDVAPEDAEVAAVMLNVSREAEAKTKALEAESEAKEKEREATKAKEQQQTAPQSSSSNNNNAAASQGGIKQAVAAAVSGGGAGAAPKATPAGAQQAGGPGAAATGTAAKPT